VTAPASLPAALAFVTVWLVLAALAGWTAARALFPPGRPFRLERLGWGLAAGLAVLAAGEGACAAAGVRPGRVALVAALAAAAVAGRLVPRPVPERGGAGPRPDREPRPPWTSLLFAVLVVGVLLYALRALTEPMWSNDFLAIWGLKAKALAGSAGFPGWLRDPSLAGFSHPEYPLGLPLLFAAISALLGRWDDQATALVYPAIQLGTLAVLGGWLRRRGASHAVAISAAALLALFEPLYSAFLTGMAEVPLSAALLLLATALADVLDGADEGAVRRLAAASLFAAALKNEGLFVAAAASIAALVALASARGSRDVKRRSLRAFAAALGPALGVSVLMRAAAGTAPLRDFDLRLLTSGPSGDLAARIAETVRADADLAAKGWPVLLAIAALVLLGRGGPSARRILILGAAGLAVYLTIPVISVRGPRWLAETTLPRTAAALAPLAAAGIGASFVKRPSPDRAPREG
jgi:hypothetical protein